MHEGSVYGHCTEHCDSTPTAAPPVRPGPPVRREECNLFRGSTERFAAGQPLNIFDFPGAWNAEWWNLSIIFKVFDIDEMYHHDWLGFLGHVEVGFPYPYFGQGTFFIGRQGGPFPRIGGIDAREALTEDRLFELRIVFHGDHQWNVSFVDFETSTVTAERSFQSHFDPWDRGPTIVGSGSDPGQEFSGEIYCVTFDGLMMPLSALPSGQCVRISRTKAKEFRARDCHTGEVYQ